MKFRAISGEYREKMLGSRGKGLCGRVEGALCLPCVGNQSEFSEQGKHKAPSTATHPPLTPTVSRSIIRLH
jgi:hypothetical protein